MVNAHSAYNVLLGRPTLNRLRAVVSTRHMKMKLPDLSGKVIVVKSDQQEAERCYENSLKAKRGVFMVVERPSIRMTAQELLVRKALGRGDPSQLGTWWKGRLVERHLNWVSHWTKRSKTRWLR